jgi:hypothetical protein
MLMKISIYRNSSCLPKEGWIQSCISCYLFTSREYFYKKINEIEVYAFLCKDCKKVIDRRPEKITKLENVCDSYIISQWSRIHPSLSLYRLDLLPSEREPPSDLTHVVETVDPPLNIHPPPSPRRISRDPPLLQ